MRFTAKLRTLFRRSRFESELGEEMRAHVELRAQRNIAAGMLPDDARAAAQREFGNLVSLQEQVRDVRTWAWVEQGKQDLLFAVRLWRKSPAFTAVVVAMLALGIGANTTIFSALDAVMLRPLPYPEPDRLVKIFEVTDRGNLNNTSGGAYLDWQSNQTTFDAMAVVNSVTVNLRASDSPERLNGMAVSHEFLEVFGVRPVVGRGFLPADDQLGQDNNVVLLTDELWRSRFGADRGVVGQTILLDDVPRTVIGVLPPGAGAFSDARWIEHDAQFLLPLVLDPATNLAKRQPHWGNVYGRLRAGVTAAQAEQELKAIKQRLEAEYPAWKKTWSVAVRPLQALLAEGSRNLLLILLAAVALVLIIICANVANLLFARGNQRAQEIALRAALGATGSRIVRQMLAESLLLALCGGALGALLAYWGVGALRLMTEGILPASMVPRLDWRVLGFAFLATALTGLLFGVLPAWRARRADLNDALKSGGRTQAAGRNHTQSALVVIEVALTVVLLAGTGLLLRSLANTAQVDPGIDASRVLTFDLSLPSVTYQTAEQRLAFSRDVLERIRGLPGVEAAGTGMALPFRGGGFGEYLRPADKQEERDYQSGRVDFVSEGYLEALGARRLKGRLLTAADNRVNAGKVAVIDATAARLLFPNQEAVGKSLNTRGENWAIIGVVGDIVQRRLDEPHRPQVYLPQAFAVLSFSIVVKSNQDPATLAGGIRDELRRLNAGIPVANLRTLDDWRRDSLQQRKLVTRLVGSFGLAALALACIGLYGVMAYSVATRQRELSIRLALGASRPAILRLVVGEGSRLIALGLAAGLAVSLASARALASQLFGVDGRDPATLVATAFILASVALVASWLPAWRGTQIDPAAALRAE